MSAQIPRVNQLEGVKMMAYQSIQQSKVKLMNRLSYMLMEHIVEQYQINEYFRFAMAGSVSASKQIISDAIELYMQQKIQNKHTVAVYKNESVNKNQSDVMKNQQKIQIEELIEKNRDLTEQNQNLRVQCEKERRKVNKLLQKYNCLTEMMFEFKEKNQQQLKEIANNYELKLQEAHNRNIELREHIARLDTTLQFVTKTGNAFNPVLIKSPTQNTMSCANYEEKAVFIDFNFEIHNVLDLCLSSKKKDMSFSTSKCQVLYQPPNKSGKNKMQITKYDIQLIKPTIKTNTQAQTDSSQLQTSHQLPNQQKQKENPSTSSNELDAHQNKNQKSIQTDQDQPEQLRICKEELKILNHLCASYQNKSKKYKNELTVLLSQKMQLITISNKCFEDNERKTQEFLQEVGRLELKIKELSKQIQELQQQKIELLNLIQQFQVNASHSPPTLEQIKVTENLYAQSDLTDESSNQPRKDHHVYFQLGPHEQHLQKAIGSNQIIERYILKQTISRYFLQLMDSNCRGDKKLVLLNQIGECLGWSSEQYEHLQFYRQRVRLKVDKSTVVEQSEPRNKANFQDRFYRFLTNQSQTEE